MTTTLHAAANLRNAAKSCGPRTPAGKARASKNALRHGLRSELLLLPGERAEDWQKHQAGILRSLAPLGALEEALAQRVALCLWRQQRVIAYEVGVTAAGLAEVEEEARAQAVGPDLLPYQEIPDSVKLQKLLADLEEKRQMLRSTREVLQLLEQLPELPDQAAVSADAVYDMLESVEDGEFSQAEKGFLGDADFLRGLGSPGLSRYSTPRSFNHSSTSRRDRRVSGDFALTASGDFGGEVRVGVWGGCLLVVASSATTGVAGWAAAADSPASASSSS